MLLSPIVRCFFSLLIFFSISLYDVTARSLPADDDTVLTSPIRDWSSLRVKRQSSANQRQQQAHRRDPNKFLEKFGYLEKIPDGQQHDPESRTQAIRRFQKMYNLLETGQLNNATLIAMAAPRCGMPDHHNTTASRLQISASSGTPPLLAERLATAYKWHKTTLTYFFHNFFNSQKFSQQAQRNAVERALRFWSDVSPLTFREVTSGPADINIQFVAGEHTDGPQNAFDGPGGVLAHAFYPESGEAHFDNDEDWRDSETDGIDLMTVAAHELGHALGLSHSSFPGALMAPYYQGFDSAFTLTEDDITSIRSIYVSGSGGQTSRPSATTRPTTRPTTTTRPPAPVPQTTRNPNAAPDSCTVPFKATTQIYDTSVHVFADKWVWRITDAGLDSAYPQTIQAVYNYAPDTVDAAIFSTNTYYTYLFKGNKVWRYYGFRLLGGKTFDTTGNSVPAMAAITDPQGNIFLIKGPTCWQFDEPSMTVNSVPRQCVQVFPNALTNMDSSLRLSTEPNIVYFFRGPYYYKYDESARRLVDGYPKLKAGPWMGSICGGQPYTPR
jgi:matrix metalloproteinase-14 (membrane-inserted)